MDQEEAEHFKVTKEAFQRVDIKKKYGVKRLREVVGRNLDGDRASPMRSTPSWVHELVPIKHEGVAKFHSERVERKGTWTVRYEFEDSFAVPPYLPMAVRQLSESKIIRRASSSIHGLIGKTKRQCLNQERHQQRWPISKAGARPPATPVLRRLLDLTLES